MSDIKLPYCIAARLYRGDIEDLFVIEDEEELRTLAEDEPTLIFYNVTELSSPTLDMARKKSQQDNLEEQIQEMKNDIEDQKRAVKRAQATLKGLRDELCTLTAPS